MKKTILYILILAAILILVLAGGNQFPKYASRLIGFGLFLLIDTGYWIAFKKYTAVKKPRARILLNGCYWTPISIFGLFMVSSILWPVQGWTAFLRIYFTGILIPLFLWKFILIISMILGDVVALPSNLGNLIVSLYQRSRISWKRFRFFITFGIILGTFMAGLIFSGFFFWVYDFKVRTVNIEIKDLPDGFDGFRIVQLSDIHLGSWLSDKPLKRAMQLVNDQKPDVIVFTGDMVNFITSEAWRFEDVLHQMKAPSGIYSILGNHDYGDYVKWDSPAAKAQNDKDLQAFYQKLGWQLMKNSHSFLHERNDSIALLGVENWSVNKMWGRRGDLSKAISGAEGVPVKILLSHDPTHWRAEVLKKYPSIALTLSGHTHAMQMGWEIGDCRWSPAEWMFSEWAGLYDNKSVDGNDQYLYVNRGLGHLGFPGRVGIRPEITLIILHKL